MGVHDIMYHASQQLANIVRHMIHNMVKPTKELETNRASSGDSFATPTSEGDQGNQNHSRITTQI